MSATPEIMLGAASVPFVAIYGNGGGVGVFTADPALPLRRGDRVVIRTPRGTEVGAILCRGSAEQTRLLGGTVGTILRVLSAADEIEAARLRRLADNLFGAARDLAAQDDLALEIVDVEILHDGQQAMVQCLGEDPGMDRLAEILEQRFNLEIRLENVAQSARPAEEGGCGKPDCGRRGGGTCSTCSQGGGCSTCAAHVDLREYFGHLRERIDHHQRRSLA